VLGYSLILPVGGIGLLLLTIGFPKTTIPRWLSNLASASFGIYLSHVLFLEAFEFFVKRSSHVSIDYNFSVKAVEVTLIFLVSAMFTYVIRRKQIGRQILLGE
jgi:peptidoglycan/LPS O-acetylase OafA/YrhL